MTLDAAISRVEVRKVTIRVVRPDAVEHQREARRLVDELNWWLSLSASLQDLERTISALPTEYGPENGAFHGPNSELAASSASTWAG